MPQNGRIELTNLQMDLPTREMLLEQVPDDGRSEFLSAYQREIVYCLEAAFMAIKPYIVFTAACGPADGQIISSFEVRDLSMPLQPSYNWHGQNTSQWVYAGAIVYESGRVSTHH